MKAAALRTCLALDRAHASLRLKLDDSLGTRHGLGWRDFTLLAVLAAAHEDRVPLGELARPLGLPLSGVVRQLAPLEKLGLLRREGGDAAPRVVALRPGGRRLWQEARETAAEICAAALAELPAGTLAPAHLDALASSPALRLA